MEEVVRNNMKLEIKMIINVEDDITGEEIERIREEFEETAWANDCSCYQPKVDISEKGV